MSSKNTFTLLFLMLPGVASLHFNCNKRFDCRGAVYNFEIGIRAFPDKDSIRVGDTLWLEVNEPTTLNDVQTGRAIDYSGAANLGSAVGFQAFSRNESQFVTPAAGKFNCLVLKGTETSNVDSNLYHEFLFAEINSEYVFVLGIVPKESGIFRLVFSNAANVYREDDRCTKANFTLNFKDTDQHFYLFPGGANTPAGGGTYYFKVN
jgi:hypothetical protein